MKTADYSMPLITRMHTFDLGQVTCTYDPLVWYLSRLGER